MAFENIAVCNKTLLNPTTGFSLNIDTTIELNHGVVGVYGRSGQGKSSLLKVIAGLIDIKSGLLQFCGGTWLALKAESNPCVYQDQQALLFPNMTVEQNLDFVAQHSLWSKQIKFTKAQVCQWCGVTELLSQQVNVLSGGEKQRVNLARSLMSGKPILLLDEPFSALDWSARASMLSLLQKLHNEYGMAIIIVSHSLKELALCCERLLSLENGAVAIQDDIQTVIGALNNANRKHVFSRVKLQNGQSIYHHQLAKWQLVNAPEQQIYTRDLHQGEAERTVIVGANKVSLSKLKVESSSMLNQLPGEITDIKRQDGNALVTLKVGQQSLFSEITQYSLEKLGLKVGEIVYTQFKAL